MKSASPLWGDPFSPSAFAHNRNNLVAFLEVLVILCRSFFGFLLMNLKFSVGTRVFKKKPCASLKAPNRRGTIVGFVEKPNRKGARTYYYLVQLDDSETTQEWAPGVTCLIGDPTASSVAFTA